MVAVVAVRRLRALRLGRYWQLGGGRLDALGRRRCEIRISTERPLRMYDAVVAETPALDGDVRQRGPASAGHMRLSPLLGAPTGATLWKPKVSVTFRIGCLTRPRTERNDPADSFQQ